MSHDTPLYLMANHKLPVVLNFVKFKKTSSVNLQDPSHETGLHAPDVRQNHHGSEDAEAAKLLSPAHPDSTEVVVYRHDCLPVSHGKRCVEEFSRVLTSSCDVAIIGALYDVSTNYARGCFWTAVSPPNLIHQMIWYHKPSIHRESQLLTTIQQQLINHYETAYEPL